MTFSKVVKTYTLKAAEIHAKTADLYFMTRDFSRMLRGKDYFHLPENLGDYFTNEKSYFNDMKGKADWDGSLEDNVPTLMVPSLRMRTFFPSMVIQYGIGSHDKFIVTKDKKYLHQIENVCLWMQRHMQEDGSFNNRFDILDSENHYFSNCSGMTQGLAISFLTRVLRNDLGIKLDICSLEKLVERAYGSLIRPIEQGGGTLYEGQHMYICEYARKDHNIVLNGWVFGIFGLIDYSFWRPGSREIDSILEKTLLTMAKKLPSYFVSNSGWTYYDNQGRVCSPIYQSLHIHLFDALWRLTGNYEFREFLGLCRRGYTIPNRCYYTVLKILEKLLDRYRYGTT